MYSSDQIIKCDYTSHIEVCCPNKATHFYHGPNDHLSARCDGCQWIKRFEVSEDEFICAKVLSV